jgi:hypothetical protein
MSQSLADLRRFSPYSPSSFIWIKIETDYRFEIASGSAKAAGAELPGPFLR